MFIFAATVLSVFDVEKVVINDVVQEPKNEFSSGVLVYVFLSPISCCFTQRKFLYDRQASQAIPEHAQAALGQGRVPRSRARPPGLLGRPVRDEMKKHLHFNRRS
jgi:hypothetical protein